MTDNKGPRIDPRGTPMSTLLQEQVWQLSNSFYYHLKHQKKKKKIRKSTNKHEIYPKRHFNFTNFKLDWFSAKVLFAEENRDMFYNVILSNILPHKEINKLCGSF